MAPIAFLQSLRNYYSKPEDRPLISSRTATALSITFTILYVLPFYLSSLTRPSPTLPRDSPTVIRARVRSVILSCTLCAAITVLVFSNYAHPAPLEILRLLGWYPIGLSESTRTTLLTALLFAGPLFERGIVEGRWKQWIRGHSLVETLWSWPGFRNYIAGPFTEELLFRSLLVPLALLSYVHPEDSKLHLVLLTPLYFGIAHIHHFYEFVLTHPRTPLIPALLVTLFQFTYTTIFGWYATFVFLRTGSLLAVVLCHTFCNWMGLPRLWGRLERREAGQVMDETVMGERTDDTRTSAEQGRGMPSPHSKRSGKVLRVKDGKLGVGWTVAYYIVLLTGVVVFYQGFWVLTRSSMPLVDWQGV